MRCRFSRATPIIARKRRFIDEIVGLLAGMAIRPLHAKYCRIALMAVALAGAGSPARAQSEAPAAKPDERSSKEMQLSFTSCIEPEPGLPSTGIKNP